MGWVNFADKNGSIFRGKEQHKARLENREVLGDSRPFIPITFEDGLQKIVYIDTGANFTELNKYFLDGKNYDFNIMTRNYDSLSGIVQDTVKLVECDFYIGDYEFSFSSLMISDRGHPVTKYSGIIGNDIFILGGFELDWESGYFRNYLYLD